MRAEQERSHLDMVLHGQESTPVSMDVETIATGLAIAALLRSLVDCLEECEVGLITAQECYDAQWTLLQASPLAYGGASVT